MENILSGNLQISTTNDQEGRTYFQIRVAFSDKDILTIHKNSINELMDELPDIISSAIQARVITENNIN